MSVENNNLANELCEQLNLFIMKLIILSNLKLLLKEHYFHILYLVYLILSVIILLLILIF
ncbi:MAG: hypothetical protein N5P05_004524 (plasmid) [Chroococcopsis gigantea SAG 12.99]|nr:hypothetical protein [Chroococcopsis gigantea SAG 12.99]